MGKTYLVARLVLAASLFSAAAADAQARAKTCYTNFSGGGCPWKQLIPARELNAVTCDELAEIRNRILHENGFCFKDPVLKARYDNNRGCRLPSELFLPLNRTERQNLSAIRRIEKAKQCI